MYQARELADNLGPRRSLGQVLPAGKHLPGIRPLGAMAQLTVLCQLQCTIEGEQVVPVQREVDGVWSQRPPRARGRDQYPTLTGMRHRSSLHLHLYLPGLAPYKGASRLGWVKLGASCLPGRLPTTHTHTSLESMEFMETSRLRQ